MCSLYHYFSQRPKTKGIKELGFKKVLIENLFESGQRDATYYLEGVDFIGRFERFQKDFDEACKLIHVGPATLKKKNSSDHDDYRTYYDQQMIDCVASRHKKTIELFGYDF